MRMYLAEYLNSYQGLTVLAHVIVKTVNRTFLVRRVWLQALEIMPNQKFK